MSLHLHATDFTVTIALCALHQEVSIWQTERCGKYVVNGIQCQQPISPNLLGLVFPIGRNLVINRGLLFAMYRKMLCYSKQICVFLPV